MARQEFIAIDTVHLLKMSFHTSHDSFFFFFFLNSDGFNYNAALHVFTIQTV